MMNTSKEPVASINATPNKRIYRSIIADYTLNTAICELIDNALDARLEITGGPDLVVSINIDLDQQKISIIDNAGGVKESELKKLISPGETTVEGTEESIGIFGVGSKRAAVVLSQMIQITTRYHKEKTLRIEYDDAWLKHPDWNINYYRVEDISPSTTEIALSNLRFRIEKEDVDNLRNHLSATYAYFLQDRKISICLNDELLDAKFFDNWAYPPEFEPAQFIKRLSPKNTNEKIRFSITAGLVLEKGKIMDYGVYFYCNKRLITRALKTPEVGFISGLAGVPHNSMSLARIIVHIDGPSDNMPWTSNKAAINYNHTVFQAIKSDVIQAVRIYAKLSKKFYVDFEERVFPFKTGQPKTTRLENDETIKPSRLPEPPKTRKDFKDVVLELNKELTEQKPWIRGLYEAIIAENIIARQRFLEQRNRISLIILDSTLEIALKNFLAYEIAASLNDESLTNLFNRGRVSVHQEAERHLLTGNAIWQKINYFYRLRCDLIHRRADVRISDENIDTFRQIVMTVLTVAFNIEFPEE